MKTRINLLIVLSLLYIVAIVPVAVAQTKKESEAKLLGSMNSFSATLAKTMGKWEKDIKATTDQDEIRMISIKAMGPIVDALAEMVKETTESAVDLSTKETVLTGLQEKLTQLKEMKADFQKEQDRREEFKKLSAEIDLGLKKIDANVTAALKSWMKERNIR